jgi:hypothetical protein
MHTNILANTYVWVFGRNWRNHVGDRDTPNWHTFWHTEKQDLDDEVELVLDVRQSDEEPTSPPASMTWHRGNQCRK